MCELLKDAQSVRCEVVIIYTGLKAVKRIEAGAGRQSCSSQRKFHHPFEEGGHSRSDIPGNISP